MKAEAAPAPSGVRRRRSPSTGSTSESPVERGHRLGHSVAEVLARRPAPDSDAIQRAIGFEYEFGATTFFDDGIAPRRPLTKGEEMTDDLGGFKATGDELAGGSDLEMIVSEIDDAEPANRGELERRLTNMQGILQLLALQGDHTGAPVEATKITGKPSYYVNANSGNLTAGQLQATVGLSLDALTSIRSGNAGKKLDKATPKPTGNFTVDSPSFKRRVAAETVMLGGGAADPDLLQATLKHVGAFLGTARLDKAFGDPLITLATLVAQMPFVARKAFPKVPYPKATAGALMNRTDFVTIISMLPGELIFALHKNDTAFADLIESIVDEAGPRPLKEPRTSSRTADAYKPHHGGYPTPSDWDPGPVDQPIFTPSSFQQDSEAPDYSGGLKLRSWVLGLVADVPVDQLTQATYPQRFPQAQAEWLESIGSFGDKTDSEFEREGGRRAIFEMRSFPNVTLDNVVEVGLAIWDYVGLAHGRSVPKTPLPKSQGKQSDKDCFLTTACVEARGLPDDCLELMVLRKFRDTHVRQATGGDALIGEYYAVAPRIVAAIGRRPARAAIWDELYRRLVLHCVGLIALGRLDEALAAYRATVVDLEARYVQRHDAPNPTSRSAR